AVLFFYAEALGHAAGVQLLLLVGVPYSLLVFQIEERLHAAYGVMVSALTFLLLELGNYSLLPDLQVTLANPRAIYHMNLVATFVFQILSVAALFQANVRSE